MAKVSPEEYQEKHARRLKASTDDMRRGIERVTESPMLKAAAKKDKMKQKLNEALDNGKWERGLARVSLEDWKADMIEKGVNRVGTGIDRAKKKVIAFATELLPFQDTLANKVHQMPDVSIEDSISRATEWIRGMAQFKRTK